MKKFAAPLLALTLALTSTTAFADDIGGRSAGPPPPTCLHVSVGALSAVVSPFFGLDDLK